MNDSINRDNTTAGSMNGNINRDNTIAESMNKQRQYNSKVNE